MRRQGVRTLPGWLAAPGRLAAGGGRRVSATLAPMVTRMTGWVAQVGRACRRLIAPLAAVLSGPLSTISGLGRGTVTVALVALVGGLALGWAELVAMGVVLLLAVALAVAFVLGRPSYEVRIDLAALRVVVGERASGEIRVRNTSERSTAPSLVELPVGRGIATFAVPRLAPGTIHDELFTIPTQRRAVLTMGPVRSVRQDPLGLLRRQVEWTRPEIIYVHPRTVRLDNSSTGFVRDLEGLATKDLANDDVSFHALREYAAGDDLRHVHWRSTARTNKLMIRQFEETRRSQFVVLLSTRPADYADEDEFELAVSIAASLARSALVDGKEVGVFTSDALLPAPTPVRLLDSFAAVEPSLSREPYGARARVVASDAPTASVVALVTGAAMAVEELRLAAIRMPATARCYGVRAATAEELGRRSVRDFEMVTVPRLEDLPMAVRVVSA